VPRRRHTVVLDLTERCNLRCVMCYFSTTDRLRFPPFGRELAPNGNMPLAVFERVAATYFPHAWRVALACATEPLIHREFGTFVRIAGRYRIPELWFPTNLLALNEEKAKAIVDAGVHTVAVSVDGMRAETYEKIRIGGRFAQLEERLALLNEARKGSRTRLRIIFTWMRSNRAELQLLPAFAAAHGAAEIDVRFVTPTVGVDNAAELLANEDPGALDDELAAAAEEAVRLGLRLAYYPGFETPEDREENLVAITRRALWRMRAGLYRWEYFDYELAKWRNGCAYPGRTYVIRPNGAVAPCIFWNDPPLALLPEMERAEVDRKLAPVREGLRNGEPIGTCVTCTVRGDAFYQPFRGDETRPLID